MEYCVVFIYFPVAKKASLIRKQLLEIIRVPETIPLTFTDPQSFEWETITSDTLTTPVTYSLNVDALTNAPFELNTFKPLKSPMQEYDLDWDSFPTEQLKLDSVPFTITKAPIKKPTITKMKPPGIMEGTYANLLKAFN